MMSSEEVYERVNCYGIGAWLEAYAQSLSQSLSGIQLLPGIRRVTPQASGVALTLYRLASSDPADELDQIVLERIEFETPTLFPLGLDAATDTPASASAKLSADIVGGTQSDFAAGNMRVSYFMPAARVVVLTFNAGLVGFGRVVLARLGTPLDWRKPDHGGATDKI